MGLVERVRGPRSALLLKSWEEASGRESSASRDLALIGSSGRPLNLASSPTGQPPLQSDQSGNSSSSAAGPPESLNQKDPSPSSSSDPSIRTPATAAQPPGPMSTRSKVALLLAVLASLFVGRVISRLGASAANATTGSAVG